MTPNGMVSPIEWICLCRVRYTHADEHNHQVDEDGSISEPAILLQSSNLADSETDEGPDQTANSVAKSELGNLRDGLAIADDDKADTHEELEDVDNVAKDGSI